MILQVASILITIIHSFTCYFVCLVAPGDYGAVINETIEFQTGDSSAEHTITIVNDDECEIDNEQFFSDIIGHSGIGNINVTEPTAQVIIDDQDEVECSKFSILKFCMDFDHLFLH